ncbi:MAG: hypothetical protein WBG69_04160 [Arcobacteraceae bacterium]
MTTFDTPWTLSEDGYYRVENGKLLFAPANNIEYKIEESMEVEIVTPYQLENINRILGTHYTIDEINSL